MSAKRVTMKDIAREAGVSTATVSYVLNYSNKEKISHETRMRIFEAANKLKYVPNMNAKSLASKRSYMVGIIINIEAENKKSKLHNYYDLAREMQRKLNALGYDVLLLPSKEVMKDLEIGQKRSLDAIFIVDLDKGTFKKIANQFYVPAIFIDGYIEDDIFYKILTDFDEVMDKAEEYLGKDYYVVMDDYSNKTSLETIEKRVPREDIFINKYENNLREFLEKRKDKKGLVLGELLGMQLERYVDNKNLCVVVNSEKDIMLLPDTKRIIVSNREKAERAVEVMEKLLRLENKEENNHVIYIKSLKNK
ncbi:LacI family DNA-binding transcriptional regulator [Clostridium isatidis]|uniref:Transcriptional regulator n=1 Tax=Clostridium isatidis TaxID=182773 RepID=A0A343JEG1_9CLOT|nr:LacI family DNA-binding transcriptional regulator [Clostridium isatidis]ASW43919.1 transcriptional regulator [Clostridium isatidis]